MSQQEGQFMPPNQKHRFDIHQQQDDYIPRPVNRDPREQAQWQTMPPPTGTQRMMGEKIQPLPQMRKRHRLAGCLITGLVLLLLVAGLIGYSLAVVVHAVPASGATTTEQQTFAVNANPRLIIIDPSGTITVHTAGASDQITINATKQGEFPVFSDPNAVTINGQDTNNIVTYTVNDSGEHNPMATVNVNLDVTVPNTSDLQIQTNLGSIDVTGVSGQMDLTSNTGTINVDNSFLTSDSNIKTNLGSVNFNGQITNGGTYDFESNTGSVNVNIPADTTFHVDAKTDTGSINSDFPVGVQKSTVGAEVHADVGNAPTTLITLKTNTGSINLGQQ